MWCFYCTTVKTITNSVFGRMLQIRSAWHERWSMCWFETGVLKLNWVEVVKFWDYLAPSFHNDTPSDGMVRRLGLCSLSRPWDSPWRPAFFCLLCLPVTLILSGSEAHFIVSVSCEPVVCLHSLSPLCQALTDKASAGANLPPSAPLAVPGLHSTTN